MAPVNIQVDLEIGLLPTQAGNVEIIKRVAEKVGGTRQRPLSMVRIPRHPATQSALIWPGIPRPPGHLFHGHPAGQSERSDAGVA
ncbi:hypothetical protein, partial [Pseudomonas aeruginosa]|uniref:hypothetical protein n=1 Tax=Pseudomonas aeruginosa TaxID=287 RepID=UPI001E5F7159